MNCLYFQKRGIIEDVRGDDTVAFSRGQKEPLPEVETNVWSCTGDECQGWMRESFSFEKEPECPLCKAKMELEVRMLPGLE